jgi:urea transport system ATP-binding protein
MSAAAAPILELRDVHVSFDGFKALNGLSLSIAPGELRCLIGPNGAGKTTLMDVITGKTRPERGVALLEGRVDLTRLDEPRIARAGVGRKFQRPSVLESHTVYENLELALKGDRGVLRSLLSPLDAGQRARLEATLRRVDLVREAHRLAGTLSHGQKQWLEIGMLLVQEPKLLCSRSFSAPVVTTP